MGRKALSQRERGVEWNLNRACAWTLGFLGKVALPCVNIELFSGLYRTHFAPSPFGRGLG